MKVKKSYGLTMFLDDMTEMAGVVTKPNGKNMVYAQASGSLLCRCMTEPRYRHYRMRACEEEHDVCSSFPRSSIAESEFYGPFVVKLATGKQHVHVCALADVRFHFVQLGGIHTYTDLRGAQVHARRRSGTIRGESCP